jgi:hypothetical protein
METLLLQLPVEEKFIKVKYVRDAYDKIYTIDANKYVWVEIDGEEWMVPKSKLFKHFND